MEIDSHLNKSASMLEMFYRDQELKKEIQNLELKNKGFDGIYAALDRLYPKTEEEKQKEKNNKNQQYKGLKK